ncbi:MAG: hypothetical protein LBK03_04210 [Bacteroidales bacterium]|jgi:hypothetical protein|nr:hypothetical protein [Bacteroidales bacterium]
MKRSSKHPDSKSLMYVILYIYADTLACLRSFIYIQQKHAFIFSMYLSVAICTAGCGETDINALFHADNGLIYPIVGNMQHYNKIVANLKSFFTDAKDEILADFDFLCLI